MWLELHHRIETKKKKKKAEEQRLADEAKALEIKRQFLNADASKVEEMKWKELEKGAEREAKQRQREYQDAALRGEALKEKDAVQKARNVRERQRAKEKRIRTYDKSVVAAEKVDAVEKYQREQNKIAKAQTQHQLEANQRQRVKDAYPQVHNFSQVVNKTNKKSDSRKIERARLSPTLPGVS